VLGTTDPALQDNIRHSLVDGALANMFATLTGGVFLTGFALYLGMNEVMIGILAAMPFLATVFQLPASYVIERKGGRRLVAYGAAAMARTVWIVILVVGLLWGERYYETGRYY